MNTKSVSVKQVIDRCKRHPLMNDLQLETAIDYAVDFIELVGVPDIYDEKFAKIKIDNHRGLLPCDFLEMIQVRTDSRHPMYYRYTTDTFHCSNNHKVRSLDLTYKIQGNVIFTSNKEGDIEICYKAICVDCDGFPLIPDNSKFIKALENYIKLQHFTILFDSGKLQLAILQNTQQEYDWSVGQCSTGFKMTTLDEAEAIFNNWRQIVINNKENLTGYVNQGIRKDFRVH